MDELRFTTQLYAAAGFGEKAAEIIAVTNKTVIAEESISMFQ
jgi:hypothetical protein